MSRTMLAAMAAMMAAGAAQGAVETWEVPFTAFMMDSYTTAPFQCDLPLFDTMGGTRHLTGVSLSGSMRFTSVVLVDSFTPIHWPFMMSVAAEVPLPGAAMSAIASQTQMVDLGFYARMFYTFDATASFGVETPDPTLYAVDGASVLQLNGLFVFEATDFEVYTGASTMMISSPAMEANLDVVYTYEIVPAPGAGAILLGGVAMMARRRR